MLDEDKAASFAGLFQIAHNLYRISRLPRHQVISRLISTARLGEWLHRFLHAWSRNCGFFLSRICAVALNRLLRLTHSDGPRRLANFPCYTQLYCRSVTTGVYWLHNRERNKQRADRRTNCRNSTMMQLHVIPRRRASLANIRARAAVESAIVAFF